MVLWAAAHENVGNQALVRLMKQDKQKFLDSVRERWQAQIDLPQNAKEYPA